MSEIGLYFFRGIYEIHHKGALVLCLTVQAGDRLHGHDGASELLVNIHDAELVFVKTRLQLIRHDNDSSIIVFPDDRLDVIGRAVFQVVSVHGLFGEF